MWKSAGVTKSLAGPKVKSGRGGRFIIIHAGSQQGFVPGCLDMFKSRNGAKGDYHNSMDHQRFKNWFEVKLLKNIPSNSVIIVDNASYHSKNLNKTPVASNRKEKKIIHWMQMNGIPADLSLSKSEILQICKETNTNNNMK